MPFDLILDGRGVAHVPGDALHSRPLPLNYGATGGYVNPANPAIYLAVGGELKAVLAVADPLKPEVRDMVAALRERELQARQIVERETVGGEL